MRHSDIGVLDGPVLVFGGPYSNMQATQAVLEEVAARAATGICTGDTVAYCAKPRETLDLIRASGCAVVAGNCEAQLAQDADGCGCGFEPGTTCDVLSDAWYSFAARSVRPCDRKWMGALPDIITFHHRGARYGVIHGAVTDVARFIWPTTAAAVFEAEWDALEAMAGPVDHIIAGHCGLAFERPLRRGNWVNAGVVGMPPNDGRQATRFAVVQGGAVSIHTLSYDVAAAVSDMRDAGLTQGYHTALDSGYWPSEDVLPLDLRVSCASG
ncbi:MAG: metallophosphoesterase [Pseudomonadota bacterium]